MKESGLEQAGERLAWAEAAAKDLVDAEYFDDAEKAWVNFLVAASAFFSKLEQAGKGHGKSEAFFGRVKRQRKKDPVLRYLKFSRNCDQHGIERITEQDMSNTESMPFNKRKKVFLFKLDKETGEPINRKGYAAFAFGPRLRCVTVVDKRHAVSCEPPLKAIEGDQDLHGDVPQDIAQVAIEKLRHILDDAEKLDRH